jgi:hypothetical protein
VFELHCCRITSCDSFLWSEGVKIAEVSDLQQEEGVLSKGFFFCSTIPCIHVKIKIY